MLLFVVEEQSVMK